MLCRIRPILDVERRSGEDVDVTEVPNEEELYVQRDQQVRACLCVLAFFSFFYVLVGGIRFFFFEKNH